MLRKAFLDTMKDKDFLADAEKVNLDIDVATPEQVEAVAGAVRQLSEERHRQGQSGDRAVRYLERRISSVVPAKAGTHNPSR